MMLLNKKDVIKLLDLWSHSFEVYAPTRYNNEDVVLLPFDEKNFTMDYLNMAMPVKEYLFEQKESLYNWQQSEAGIRITEFDAESLRPRILFGVRACDAYGIAYLDRFYIEEFRDHNYAGRREKTYIVVVNCIEPGYNCYCSSTGVGPFAQKGYDLMLTPLGDEYLVEAGSDKGKELIEIGNIMDSIGEEAIELKNILKSAVEDKFLNKIDLSYIAKVMDETYNNDVWKEISKQCIACTGCTSVCPTCTCFNIVEEDSCYGEKCRVRYWDSCQSDSFTRNAGGHNPRSEVSRVRYRIYDKLKYIEERFGFKGCTGCGRCINVCPAFIDIIEIASKLKQEYKYDIAAMKKNNASVRFEIHTHDQEHRCENAYKPQIAIIKDIIQETRDIKRFIVQYEDETLHENYKFTGQFFEITIFGVGEIAISIPFGPSQKNYFDFCVKKAGRVTTAMHGLQVGDKIGLRGPFGKGFPYEELKGKDILIVGSGVGLAPVRTMIIRIIENKKDFGNLAIIASATSYEGLVYKEDLLKWSEIDGVKVLYALSKPTDKVDAYVGYINDLLPDLGLEWKKTASIICASPRRIKAVAEDLIKLGMKGTDILTSLETHMRCGIGKCGHCKVGNKYMCVDGPVFNYEEMLTLPPEF
ncbi:MAG TPA: 4Fe-4S dicluster domain-containing protein [Bacillota bacterium]|nr:4Fe-4S dicluster domain-containing protein [Bacillota bacterium]